MKQVFSALKVTLESRRRVVLTAQRRAAVLIPIIADDTELRLLLTRRTETLSSHRGQVAFPGGGADETLLENNKEFKRYKQRKKDGSLPRHHYTDDEWKELNRRKKYHDWVTDENRPLGGSHQHKANFSTRKKVLKKKRNFVFNDKKREDDD